MVNLKTKALAIGLALLAPPAFAQELPLNEASSRQNPAAVSLLPAEISAGLKARPDVMDAFSGNFSVCSPDLPVPFRIESSRETYGGGAGTNTASLDIGGKVDNVFIGMRALFEKSYDAQAQKNGATYGVGAITKIGRVRAFAQIGNAAVAGADILLGSTTVSSNLNFEKTARPQLSAGFDHQLKGSLRGVTITGSLGAKGDAVSRLLAGMQINTIHGRFGAVVGVERRDGKFKPVAGTTVALRL